MNNCQHTTYPIIPPPPPPSSNRYVTERKKEWMKKTTGKYHDDGINGCNEEEAETSRQKISVDPSQEKEPKTKLYYLDSRDDQDELIEEERIRLFARSSSLSFSIDHYCMMVGKVRVLFLFFYFHIVYNTGK